ncbi:MAG: glycosyltransferase family 4 protein [Betaproteobacteria bacterium]|jgi:glycosyltransferase involved in cell wall biosynthesis
MMALRQDALTGPRPVLVVGPHSVHVRRFVAGLCEAGRDVVLVTNGATPLLTHERLREQVFMSLRLADARTPQRLRALIERWQPAVVHVHQADATAWHAVRAARPTGVPVVLTLWGSDVLSLPHRGWWQRALVRSALRGAAAWTADARVLLQAAQAIAGAGALPLQEWIPLGIDAPPAEADLGAVVRERRILSCRLHKPLYRIDAIVRAFAQAAPLLPGWLLEVAAAGEQTPALHELAQSLGVADRVEFTGLLSTPELARAYRRSALFVSVPESDGTSVSLLESMAAGCLPVLADLPANREWVRDGENGLIVGQGSAVLAAPLVDALAQALVRGARWWSEGGWDASGRPLNETLIAQRATLAANIQQFLALHQRLASSRRPIVHLTTVHPRDDIRIFRKECVSLAQAGYEVVQVVGDGLGDAEVQGVRIVDIGPRPAGRLARMRQQPAKALAAVRALHPALVHLHDPELLPLGAKLAREGLTVVYDAHEDVPRQLLTKQWIPAWARRPLSAAFEVYENHRVRQLAAVVGATPHITQRFAAVARRSVNVSNFPFLDELAPDTATSSTGTHAAHRICEGPLADAGLATPPGVPPRENAVCYVGGIFLTRGAFSMVRALTHLPGVRLLLCGRFEDAATETALRAEPGWAQVDYLGVLGREGVREVMARSRAGLVTLLPLPSYLDSLPIKMFEYMSASLPVIASDFPLWRDIVQRHACGLCVDPSDPSAVAQAIRQVLDDPAAAQAMGRAGREAVHAHYHWPRAEAELLALYRSLLPQASVSAP